MRLRRQRKETRASPGYRDLFKRYLDSLDLEGSPLPSKIHRRDIQDPPELLRGSLLPLRIIQLHCCPQSDGGRAAKVQILVSLLGRRDACLVPADVRRVVPAHSRRVIFPPAPAGRGRPPGAVVPAWVNGDPKDASAGHLDQESALWFFFSFLFFFSLKKKKKREKKKEKDSSLWDCETYCCGLLQWSGVAGSWSSKE